MKLTIRETAVFAMLGAVMYCSKMIMEIAPNVHLLGAFVVAFTVVYRKKALYPIYVFVFITGLMSGFAAWWVPYLYIWAVLFGLDFQGMVAWIVAGLPWDMIHGISNLLCGVLIWPLVKLLQKIEKQSAV